MSHFVPDGQGEAASTCPPSAGCFPRTPAQVTLSHHDPGIPGALTVTLSDGDAE